jgi:phosphoribosylformylglycinamidine synthase
MISRQVCILRAAGTNCDLETQHAWELCGAIAERVHIRRLTERPGLLDRYAILTIPGGFSYGDDISAGRIFAAQIERRLIDQLLGFMERGGLVLGICNGFQVLVKAGLLPFPDRRAEPRRCTITYNAPRGFQDRWVTLKAGPHACAFLEADRTYELPIAHGEGRVLFSDAGASDAVTSAGLDVLKYAEPPAEASGSGCEAAGAEPFNPNGSTADIAGLCDPSGQLFGLMPHPERFVTGTQHPCWTSRPARDEGDGLAMFRRALAHVSSRRLARV